MNKGGKETRRKIESDGRVRRGVQMRTGRIDTRSKERGSTVY